MYAPPKPCQLCRRVIRNAKFDVCIGCQFWIKDNIKEAMKNPNIHSPLPRRLRIAR